jgi:hypothetical protein
MQRGGNLVLWHPGPITPWISGTVGWHYPDVEFLDDSGNRLVLAEGLSQGRVKVIGSAAGGGPNSYLRILNDGNVVQYNGNNNPIWSTNTVYKS